MIINSLETRSVISGDILTIPYYTWTGGSGPSVYIQAGIHGQEYMGYGVTLCLIEHFKAHPPKVNVTIVPKANPYGMNVKMGDTTYGRFDPTTGSNWNRNYYNWLEGIDLQAFIETHKGKSWSQVKQALKDIGQSRLVCTDMPYANKLARQIQALAIQHDIMLDLHCDSVSLPYVYCHDYAIERAKTLAFPYYLTMQRYFKGSFDDATIYPFWTVFEAMGFESTLDMEAYTIELGHKEYFDLTSCQIFADKIINFLEPLSGRQPISASEQHITSQHNFCDIHSPVAGMVYDFAPLGQLVPAGQPLCMLLKTHNHDCLLHDRILPITYPKDCTPIAHTPAGAVHEGVTLLEAVF